MPYPFIRTKWLVERIASGEVIKVVANDPDALENIDAWTKRSGDRILRYRLFKNTDERRKT